MPKRPAINLSTWQNYTGAPASGYVVDPLEDDANGLLVDAIASKWPTVAMKEGK